MQQDISSAPSTSGATATSVSSSLPTDIGTLLSLAHQAISQAAKVLGENITQAARKQVSALHQRASTEICGDAASQLQNFKDSLEDLYQAGRLEPLQQLLSQREQYKTGGKANFEGAVPITSDSHEVISELIGTGLTTEDCKWILTKNAIVIAAAGSGTSYNQSIDPDAVESFPDRGLVSLSPLLGQPPLARTFESLEAMLGMLSTQDQEQAKIVLMVSESNISEYGEYLNEVDYPLLSKHIRLKIQPATPLLKEDGGFVLNKDGAIQSANTGHADAPRTVIDAARDSANPLDIAGIEGLFYWQNDTTAFTALLAAVVANRNSGAPSRPTLVVYPREDKTSRTGVLVTDNNGNFDIAEHGELPQENAMPENTVSNGNFMYYPLPTDIDAEDALIQIADDAKVVFQNKPTPEAVLDEETGEVKNGTGLKPDCKIWGGFKKYPVDKIFLVKYSGVPFKYLCESRPEGDQAACEAMRKHDAAILEVDENLNIDMGPKLFASLFLMQKELRDPYLVSLGVKAAVEELKIAMKEDPLECMALKLDSKTGELQHWLDKRDTWRNPLLAYNQVNSKAH